MLKKYVSKTAVFLIILFAGVVLLESVLFVKAGKNLFSGILNNQTIDFEKNFKKVRSTLNYFNRLTDFDKYFSLLPEILGRNGRKVYFVLLQNNKELRATGGFLGSYAKLIFENGGLREIIVQDIYEPDGQIKGHVDPPAPIQKAFKQGWFRLRDANWDPDFRASAGTVAWFFEKGGEEKADGIIAINLDLVEDFLRITGPVYLTDYQKTVDSNNFYQIAQEYSETDFFPGSKQKANILGALSGTLFSEVKNLRTRKLLSTTKIVLQNLKNRQILLYSFNPKIQELFSVLGWDGAMKKNNKENNKINDYFYLVESNLGANKANCCIERSLFIESEIYSKETIKKRVQILFNNSSKYWTPVKPSFWGGNYSNFLRIYYPFLSKNLTVKIDDKEIDKNEIIFEEKKELNLAGAGFFVVVPALSKVKVEINYEFPIIIPENNKVVYTLTIQKQPGIKSLPFKTVLIGNGKTFFSYDKELAGDKVFEAKFVYN